MEMRRVGASLALAVCMAAGTIGVVSAAPDKGCPDVASGFQSIGLNFTWQSGDPVPAPGEDAWWDLTLAGFAAEGETPESQAAALGLGSVDELYEFVVLGIRGVDKNGDGSICWKAYPDASNPQPAYFFNVTDGNAAQH
jgi:hypothetical protein